MEWQTLVEYASIILGVLSGVGAVPLVNWVKSQFNLEGRWVQLLVAVVATIFALLNMLVVGQISPEKLQPERLVELFLAVLVASQAEYQRIKNNEQKKTAKAAES